jgi:hypothetical protein
MARAEKDPGSLQPTRHARGRLGERDMLVHALLGSVRLRPRV